MATVTRVVDGDTFDAVPVGRVRLADIDAPEVGQPGAAAATAYLVPLVLRRLVYLDVDDVHGTDPYGRLVAVAYVRHNATHLLNVNLAMVEAGHARVVDFPNAFDPVTWSLYVPHPEEESEDGGPDREVAVAVAVLFGSPVAVCLLATAVERRRRG